MKPQAASSIFQHLDEEFAWRRKELTTVKTDVESATEETLSTRIRACVALLYAHWEGFVKAAAEAYVRYVSGKRLRLCDLNTGFLALALRSKLHKFRETNDASFHVEFVDFVRTGLESRAQLPTFGAIRTGSNLNSRRLREIILTLGLDYKPFELKGNLIDSELLGNRNTIAHGKFRCPKRDEFEVLYEEVTTLLRSFKDQLENAILQEEYSAKGIQNKSRTAISDEGQAIRIPGRP